MKDSKRITDNYSCSADMNPIIKRQFLYKRVQFREGKNLDSVNNFKNLSQKSVSSNDEILWWCSCWRLKVKGRNV